MYAKYYAAHVYRQYRSGQQRRYPVVSDEYSERTDVEPPRMYIDMHPPANPQKGDVWIRLGEARVWAGGWEPPWLPPKVMMPSGYPRPGRRKRKSDGGSSKDC